jgi:hypothetical protein
MWKSARRRHCYTKAARTGYGRSRPNLYHVTAGGTCYERYGRGIWTLSQGGEEVTVYYKALALVRSYDGLSGEGTVVFSRDMVLKMTRRRAGEKNFITTVGSSFNIAALNEVIPGMKVNGFAAFPFYRRKDGENRTTC